MLWIRFPRRSGLMPIIAEDSQLIVVVCHVTSVADPFHFDTDPDPTKNQKKIIFFFV